MQDKFRVSFSDAKHFLLMFLMRIAMASNRTGRLRTYYGLNELFSKNGNNICANHLQLSLLSSLLILLLYIMIIRLIFYKKSIFKVSSLWVAWDSRGKVIY